MLQGGDAAGFSRHNDEVESASGTSAEVIADRVEECGDDLTGAAPETSATHTDKRHCHKRSSPESSPQSPRLQSLQGRPDSADHRSDVIVTVSPGDIDRQHRPG
jgi:hypothetical protein